MEHITMSSKFDRSAEQVRDGVEVLPEFADIALELPPAVKSKPEELLDEALVESFPASDPMASGRMEWKDRPAELSPRLESAASFPKSRLNFSLTPKFGANVMTALAAAMLNSLSDLLAHNG